MCYFQIKIQNFLKFYMCLSILMHLTGVKFLRNDLKETGDMAIHILPCKIICMRTCSYIESIHKVDEF